jgi:hypothetical protein
MEGIQQEPVTGPQLVCGGFSPKQFEAQNLS